MEDNFYVGDIFHSKKRNSKIEKETQDRKKEKRKKGKE